MSKLFSLMRIGIAGFVISSLTYSALFYFNSWLTSSLIFSSGVNWIYLPAGLRLFLTLIFGLPAALGIAFASFLISYCGGLSLLSSGLHQFWYATVELDDAGSLNHFLVMFIGDVMGSLLLISLIKSGLDFLKRFRRTVH